MKGGRAIGPLLAAVLWLATPGWALNAGLPEPVPENRETPLASLQGFLQAAHAGKHLTAAHFLQLDHLPRSAQAIEGPRLARRLKFVLDRQAWIDLARVSNDPNGDPEHPGYDQLAVVPLGTVSQPIRVRRADLGGGEHAWVFTEDTVRAIDRLYDEHGPPFGEYLPDLLFRGSVLGIEPWQWIGLFGVLLGATLLSALLQRWLLRLGLRLAQLSTTRLDDELVEASRGPLKLPVWAAVVAAGTRSLLLPPTAQRSFDLLVRSLVIFSVAWFALRAFRHGANRLQARIAGEEEDPASLRGMQTQLAVLRRLLEVAIYFLAAALFLMQFEVVRNVGVSLLASAGIAGLVLGLAAQKSISTLLAGLQLSITQPIRMGDTVVVEGEMGTIEEITLSYVVVRIWDKRRLVVPMTYFLDKPFQNWSKATPELLGTVEIHADYSVDVEAVRTELGRILRDESLGLWDTHESGLQVTGAGDKTVILRALVSAASPGAVWDLRCLVREKLVGFLQRNPGWLPRMRTESQPTQDVASGR